MFAQALLSSIAHLLSTTSCLMARGASRKATATLRFRNRTISQLPAQDSSDRRCVYSKEGFDSKCHSHSSHIHHGALNTRAGPFHPYATPCADITRRSRHGTVHLLSFLLSISTKFWCCHQDGDHSCWNELLEPLANMGEVDIRESIHRFSTRHQIHLQDSRSLAAE